jgi:hypothetical protein
VDTRTPQPTATDEGKCDTCVPCDVPMLCRNAFFTGKLLTERDFTLEQQYFIDKSRLHHLALHGWGIACGLTLTPHPYCPQLRIFIEPGVAIDGCGREILVRERIEWNLPQLDTKPTRPKDPCPPEPKGNSTAEPKPSTPRPDPAQSADQARTPRYDQGPPSYAGRPPQPSRYDDEPDQCGPDTDLYLSLCYDECESERVPAPFDECACNGITKRASRICQTFCIAWSTTRPKDWPDDDCDGDDEEDCALIYERIRAPCVVPTEPRCLPLAVIRGYEPGKPVTTEMVDYRDRRDLASTRLLDLLVRCILHKLPTKNYTKIEDMNWEHGLEYTCRQFQQMFVGDEKSQAGLEVKFTKPVRTETLSTLSFQAIVVRHTHERKEGGYMEVAPATAWASPDRRRFYLRIDPGYAQHCLECGSFDIFVVLRCNALVDDDGLAVDGTLLARKAANDVIVGPPTGDGIAGGTFESWFRVHD